MVELSTFLEVTNCTWTQAVMEESIVAADEMVELVAQVVCIFIWSTKEYLLKKLWTIGTMQKTGMTLGCYF